MTVPQITAVRLGGSPALPLLVLGPALGTSAKSLWSEAAVDLADRFEVIAWDLPGHGTNSIAARPYTVAELAAGVLEMVDDMLAERGAVDSSFVYAGDSIGGAVGLHLLLDAPRRVPSAILIGTGATIGDADQWREDAATARAAGAPSVLGAAADREGYALACEALAGHDVRHRLARITAPVLAVAVRGDDLAPLALLQEIADGVRTGRLVVLDDVSSPAPTHLPQTIAQLIAAHVAGEEPAGPSPTVAAVLEAGEAVRRQVLGDAHVDHVSVATSDVTADFHALATQYEWGSVWARPGLDRRSRSLITLTALVARGHLEELALHVRAARTNGLSANEIKELLLQTAIYCGVPDATRAFGVAERVLAELEQERP